MRPLLSMGLKGQVERKGFKKQYRKWYKKRGKEQEKLLNQDDPRQDRWPRSNYTQSSDTGDLFKDNKRILTLKSKWKPTLKKKKRKKIEMEMHKPGQGT